MGTHCGIKLHVKVVMDRNYSIYLVKWDCLGNNFRLGLLSGRLVSQF